MIVMFTAIKTKINMNKVFVLMPVDCPLGIGIPSYCCQARHSFGSCLKDAQTAS